MKGTGYGARPRGRLSEQFIRRELSLIQRELRDKTLTFTAKERMTLHARIERLQEQLRLIEIERLESELASSSIPKGNEADAVDGDIR